MPILVKKTSILSETRCSHVLFFNFFMKNSCYRAHDWSKNVNFVKTTLYFGPKKSQDALFSYVSRKNYCSYVNILSKKRPFSKKKQLSSPRFVKKTSTLLKTQCSHVFFFSKTPHTLMSIFCQKTSILSKLQYLMGHKSP